MANFPYGVHGQSKFAEEKKSHRLSLKNTPPVYKEGTDFKTLD